MSLVVLSVLVATDHHLQHRHPNITHVSDIKKTQFVGQLGKAMRTEQCVPRQGPSAACWWREQLGEQPRAAAGLPIASLPTWTAAQPIGTYHASEHIPRE